MNKVKEVKLLIELLEEHQLDVLECGDIKLVKTNHYQEVAIDDKIEVEDEKNEAQVDEDLLFFHEGVK
jgi:hypothetical protein